MDAIYLLIMNLKYVVLIIRSKTSMVKIVGHAISSNLAEQPGVLLACSE